MPESGPWLMNHKEEIPGNEKGPGNEKKKTEMVKPPEPGGPRVPLDEKVGLPKRQKGGEGGGHLMNSKTQYRKSSGTIGNADEY